MSSRALTAPYRGLTHVEARRIAILPASAIHLDFAYGTVDGGGSFVADPDFQERTTALVGDAYTAFLATVEGAPMSEAGISQALMAFLDAAGRFNPTGA